ncbi:tRNA methyltransferase 10 C [Mactra antiquata]
MISLCSLRKGFQYARCKYLQALNVRLCSEISTGHDLHGNKVGKNDKVVCNDILKQEVNEFMANVDNHPVYSERKKAILSYIDAWKYSNILLPEIETISDLQWYVLLTERYKPNMALAYLDYVRKTNNKKAKDKEMKELKRINKIEKEKERDHNKDYFDFSVHIPDRDKKSYNWNKIKAWQSDIPIVIDLNFEDCSFRELTAADQQISLCLTENTQHLQPLNVHITSVHANKRISYKHQSGSLVPATFHEEHFMDIFPRDKLAYLSPDGVPMTKFDPDLIYIIGGLVDRNIRKRLTYSCAKESGIKCYSLPLDRYVKIRETARKQLNINTVFSIMQNMYYYKSWEEAFCAGITSQKYEVCKTEKPYRRKYDQRNYSQYM